MADTWPIIIVTGANSGVGFGICHRLLVQLSQKSPPDALAKFGGPSSDADICQGYDGLTLIMACRNLDLAEVARTKLFALLDAHIMRLKGIPSYDGHADAFRRNVKIDIHFIDLAVVDSVFQFTDKVSVKYPYISHLICNAGVASFSGMDWVACLKQIFKEPMMAITAPEYHLQNVGERSADGLGWVWQCNVFGHYVLYRALESKIVASSVTPRVLWMSSCAASHKFADSDDYQLLRTERSYEASKYQMDLLSTQLDRKQGIQPIRHIIVDPGISITNISKALIGAFMEMLGLIAFYFARMFGSTKHTITPYKAATSAVQLCLVPLSQVSVSAKAPVKYSSETGRWGDERVGTMEIDCWKENEGESLKLLDQCEQLYREFEEKRP